MKSSNAMSRQIDTSRLSMPQEIMPAILSHFDVKTLIEKKSVCRNWRQICTEKIDEKRTKAFETSEELCEAVKKYTGYEHRDENWNYDGYPDPDEAEEIASTYGYPSEKWDVSNLEDFLFIFGSVTRFLRYLHDLPTEPFGGSGS